MRGRQIIVSGYSALNRLSCCRATLLKIGIVIVNVLTNVFAQVPDKFFLFVQCVLVLRMNASGSPLEKSAAPQSASLFTITVCNKALIAHDSVYLNVVLF